MSGERGKPSYVGVLSGAAAGLAAYALAGTAAPSPEARRLVGVMAAVVCWWVTEAMPLPVSALLGSSLCVLLGVAPARKVFAPYADPVIFLFLGSFWIAEAMSAHGLDRRIALRLLSLDALSRSPRRLLFGLGGVAAFISLWVSNTATTAMLLPVALGLLRAIPEDTRTPLYESRMLLMLSFAASVGGLGTPVGTPPNLIGMGMLERLAGVRLSFLDWMRVGLPVAVLALLWVFLLLGRGLPRPRGWIKLKDFLAREVSALGPMKAGERNTLAVLAFAVVLWLFAGEFLPEGVSAMLAASALFLLPAEDGGPTLTWEGALRADWGVLLLFGGGMSLGTLLFETGLASGLGNGAAAFLGVRTSFGAGGTASAVSILTSELSSNTASANIAVPFALALSGSVGAAPLCPALSAAMASSFGFLLPVSTPPNAIVYGTGKVPLREMMAAGVLLDLFGFLLVWLAVPLLA